MEQAFNARSSNHSSKMSKTCSKLYWLRIHSRAEMMLFRGLETSAHTDRLTSRGARNDLMVAIDTHTSQSRQAFEAALHRHSGTRGCRV